MLVGFAISVGLSLELSQPRMIAESGGETGGTALHGGKYHARSRGPRQGAPADRSTIGRPRGGRPVLPGRTWVRGAVPVRGPRRVRRSDARPQRGRLPPGV